MNLREKLNTAVCAAGNKAVPDLPNLKQLVKYHKTATHGLGDLLTEPVRMRALGLVGGAMTPAAATFGAAYAMSGSVPVAAVSTVVFPVVMAMIYKEEVLIPPFACACVGYTLGALLDAGAGDENSPFYGMMSRARQQTKKESGLNDQGFVTCSPKE